MMGYKGDAGGDFPRWNKEGHMPITYAIVAVFSSAADRIIANGLTASGVARAWANLDQSGNVLYWYVTRNGQRISMGA